MPAKSERSSADCASTDGRALLRAGKSPGGSTAEIPLDAATAPDTATGTVALHVPASPERERILRLVRLGELFARQQRGRRPGFLQRHIEGIAYALEHPTFVALLRELELQALKRQHLGEAASPIERVDQGFEVLTYHDPRHGRCQVALSTVRNHLSAALKKKRIHG